MRWLKRSKKKKVVLFSHRAIFFYYYFGLKEWDFFFQQKNFMKPIGFLSNIVLCVCVWIFHFLQLHLFVTKKFLFCFFCLFDQSLYFHHSHG